MASDLDWTIVRPPAIFGPRDSEMLELFKLATNHVMPLPPAGGRLSVIAVEELVRLLLALPTSNALSRQIVEPDDGRPGGWDHRDLAHAIGVATGSKVLPLPLPRFVLNAIAGADRLFRGKGAKLTPDRVRYFCHKDWVSHATPPADIWTPQIDTRDALAATAQVSRERPVALISQIFPDDCAEARDQARQQDEIGVAEQPVFLVREHLAVLIEVARHDSTMSSSARIRARSAATNSSSDSRTNEPKNSRLTGEPGPRSDRPTASRPTPRYRRREGERRPAPPTAAAENRPSPGRSRA